MVAILGPALVLFHGGVGRGTAERSLGEAGITVANQHAAAATRAGFEKIILATDEPGSFAGPTSITIETIEAAVPFDFDQALRCIVKQHSLERPVVMGASALPLFDEDGFDQIAHAIDRQGTAVTNNFYSGDLTGWCPGSAIERLPEPVRRDNLLPRRLRDDGGLEVASLPRTTATQFDLDTPTDLALLSLQPDLSDELASACSISFPLLPRARRLMSLFCDRDKEVTVAGRVGSRTWQYMEGETACRERVFSEERGLATAPPGHEPRSGLGFLLEEVGAERFFGMLESMGDGAIIDSRVLMAHAGIHPSKEDRFRSDLFDHVAIEDPWLQEFALAAADSPMPLLLGGHSLVSGGFMALNDAAWAEG